MRFTKRSYTKFDSISPFVRVGVPLASALFIIFALILLIGSRKESDPFAQFETARGRVDESLLEEAGSRRDKHLLSRYIATWRLAEDMERSESWAEALDAWNRLRMISDRMSEKPASSAQIDHRIRRALAMLRTSEVESPPPPDALDEPVAIDVPAPVDEKALSKADLPKATVYTDWPFDAGEAKRRQEETARTLDIPVEKTIDLGEGVTLEMILIPAGEFIMGSPEDEEGRRDTDGPQRRVRITRPFYLSKYPVTRPQYDQVMHGNLIRFEGKNSPVDSVSWNDAQEFMKKAGNNLRLPTEAEWEYACRAGTSTRFYSGDRDSDLDGVGWYSGNSGRRTHPVGQKKPNAWGLHDMHGNVFEWVSDWFQANYRGLETTDALGPTTGTLRVIRGGSWIDLPGHCRSAFRCRRTPDLPLLNVGFRVVAPATLASAETTVAPQATEGEAPAPVDEEELSKADLPQATVYTDWPFDAGEAQRRQRETARRLDIPLEKTIDLGEGVTLEMVLIPAGDFIMGSPNEEEGRSYAEAPQRRVRISQPFYMGKYPVTQAQYEQITPANPNRFEGKNNPADSVSWNDAQEFVKKAGNNLRLPTEAEWEYACRAGTTTRFYSGDSETDLAAVGWYWDNSDTGDGRRTHPVGQKTPNAWGLYDMHGNVWEWCSDWVQGHYVGLETTDPQGPVTGDRRVFRGGSWINRPGHCRSAVRGGDAPGSWSIMTGFRVVSPAISISAETTATPTEAERETPAPVDEEELPLDDLSMATAYTDWPFDAGEAQRRQRETARRLDIPVEKTIDLGEGVTLEMILIPAGEFIMGSPISEDGRWSDEGPLRRMRITQPFYIGKYPVTQAQYEQVMSTNPSRFEGENNPVETVSWNDAQKFIRRTGNNLRLPTEAEWEYACRAGTTTRFYSGDSESDLAAVGWYWDNSDTGDGRRTHPVGQKTPNAWGLYDMHGNVWEWVSDWYQTNYRGLETTDPQGPATGDYRVARGGSWNRIPRLCRSARRDWLTPGNRGHRNGFRVVSPAISTSAETTVTPTATVYTDWPFDAGEAQRRQEETARRLGIPVEKTIDLGEGVTLEMVLIPAGEFIMGSPEDEKRRRDNEGPQRRVPITRPFYMGKYPVTQAQYERVMGANPSHFEGSDNPLETVSWNDAQEFIRRAGNNLRLPTEAEWEYACRAGTTTRFYSGDSESEMAAVGWYRENSDTGDGRRTHPVGQKRPNAWGLHDMHGNVFEWVSDWFQEHYHGLETTDPQGPATGRWRVIRGGFWEDFPWNCRSAFRSRRTPVFRFVNVGFRVVSPAR